MNTVTTCWGCNFQPNYTMFYTILVLKIAHEKEIKVTKLIIEVPLESFQVYEIHVRIGGSFLSPSML